MRMGDIPLMKLKIKKSVDNYAFLKLNHNTANKKYLLVIFIRHFFFQQITQSSRAA